MIVSVITCIRWAFTPTFSTDNPSPKQTKKTRENKREWSEGNKLHGLEEREDNKLHGFEGLKIAEIKASDLCDAPSFPEPEAAFPASAVFSLPTPWFPLEFLAEGWSFPSKCFLSVSAPFVAFAACQEIHGSVSDFRHLQTARPVRLIWQKDYKDWLMPVNLIIFGRVNDRGTVAPSQIIYYRSNTRMRINTPWRI